MVEIHIDTKKDSDEEIRRTIRFLQGLVGDAPSPSYSSSASDDDAPPPASTGAFNMFGSDDDAPSDYNPEERDDSDDDSFIEIVEY